MSSLKLLNIVSVDKDALVRMTQPVFVPKTEDQRTKIPVEFYGYEGSKPIIAGLRIDGRCFLIEFFGKKQQTRLTNVLFVYRGLNF